MSKIIFLKLGGSLLTDKDKPFTARPQTIRRLAKEIKHALATYPETMLLLGHGSGSFGHVAGNAHRTRQGVQTPEQWLGFIDVWNAARALNQIVIKIMLDEGLPVMTFPPSAMVHSQAGKIIGWDHGLIRQALENKLIPVIHGDVVFDQNLGGTILSTEELFSHLADHIVPETVLLAGVVPGVYADFPSNRVLISTITPNTRAHFQSGLHGSASTDVTGGMIQKVDEMLALIEKHPHLEAVIFSGEEPDNLYNVIIGSKIGTAISIE